MSSALDDIRRWRGLAAGVRVYARSMRTEAARDEMIKAEGWESRADDAEATLSSEKR